MYGLLSRNDFKKSLYIRLAVCCLVMYYFTCTLSLADTLTLNDYSRSYIIDSRYFEYNSSYSDSTFYQELTYQKVNSGNDGKNFFRNDTIQKNYYYKIVLKNRTNGQQKWYLVSYNYSIDEIDVWLVNSKGETTYTNFRNTQSLSKKLLRHKQPVFPLSLAYDSIYTLYVRIKNNRTYSYVFALYPEYQFSSYFFSEYFLYGIFYGAMIFALLYNVLNYIILKKRLLLFYVFFIAIQILHMSFRDGSFVIFFPVYFLQHADLYKEFFKGLFSSSLLAYFIFLYKQEFLSKKLYVILLFALIVRLMYTFIFWRDTHNLSYHMDMIVLLLVLYTAYTFWKKGLSGAQYMVVGLLFLIVAYFVYYINVVGMAYTGGIGFFAMYFGITINALLISVGLTEWYKKLRLEIFEKEKIAEQLEQLVSNRTHMLEEQTKELNLLLYNSSHHLRGPLMSIKGICNVAEADSEFTKNKLSELIKFRIDKLDNTLKKINDLSYIKSSSFLKQPINFRALFNHSIAQHKEIIERQKTIVQYEENLHSPHQYDEYLMKIIFENLVQNALIHNSHEKHLVLKISVSEMDGRVKLSFEDNGQGIGEPYIHKIFEMFYRANEYASENAGLGLYVVKLAVEKMGGSIEVTSSLGRGSCFVIMLPF
ncbi:MAG: sensor histidine kinase [Cytophagaceae bacterium]|nr:sensor histidine kinase [Cytophagaceae bacterium]MDW8456179.1 sensor histidine kinase [Cytophagaceae bacterium]